MTPTAPRLSADLHYFPLLALFVSTASAAATDTSAQPLFDGATLSLLWGAPFAALLLAIALVPMFAQAFWHHHYGKVALGCAVALLVPFAARFGIDAAAHSVVHALLLEYLPFVIVLVALYTVAGGIAIRGRIAGTPARNTALLAAGAGLASIMGTTGAAMLLVRPLINGNAARTHRVHVMVFFIILVGNVGGALSPLGDPPLFIGFLKGVDFFWTTHRLLWPTIAVAAFLLVVFVAVDMALVRRETPSPAAPREHYGREPYGLDGGINLVLLATMIAAVLLSGVWKPAASFTIFGTPLELQNVVRDVLLLALAGLSLAVTPAGVRERNAFHWGPIAEVAKLFAAIFVTISPVIAILQAGAQGALAPVVAMVTSSAGAPHDAMYFLTTGALSAFLDNAPTYLVFFNLAGGDPQALMGALAGTLAAISMGAVYFGALTYVGNAPNFMIRAIAEDMGIRMPSFFAYLGWASLLMAVPLALIAFTIG